MWVFMLFCLAINIIVKFTTVYDEHGLHGHISEFLVSKLLRLSVEKGMKEVWGQIIVKFTTVYDEHGLHPWSYF